MASPSGDPIVGTPMTLTYSLMTQRPDYWGEGTFTEFGEAAKDAARAIFAQYEAVTLVADGDGDVFVFASGQGGDVILHFGQGPDRIEIAAGINGTDIDDFAAVLAHASDIQYEGQPSVLIDFGGGNSLIVAGVAKAELQADDFLFV